MLTSIDLLSVLDVFPPDDFVKQLIQQRKLNVTVDETKDLIQTMIDVLPLRGDDPKRVQVEKEFWNGKILTIEDREKQEITFLKPCAQLAHRTVGADGVPC